MLTIRREVAGDIAPIRYVNELAFSQKEEAGIVDKLWEGALAGRGGIVKFRSEFKETA